MDYNIYAFAEELIDTGDLDPVYILLWEADLEREKLRRWLLAYWCCYHVGTSSWVVDQPDYWTALRAVAGSKEYPRCRERRHWRGENARKSVEWLAERGVQYLFKPLWQSSTAEDVMEWVQTWVGFGPWISFKVADMVERLAIAPLKFSPSVVLYDSPRKGAAEMFRRVNLGKLENKGPPIDSVPENRVGEWALASILRGLASRLAPPRGERGVSYPEAETVLCKWNSSLSGHYRLGEDIKACRSGLLRFARSKTSQCLLRGGKTGGLWDA